ncbi:MAG: peptidoglycan recognition family protein [bacterium]|nr:peptidoglycan recognition family protein [bacterium]
MDKRKVIKIYIHHSALSPDIGLEAIRELHIKRGFDDIGYHFVIEKNGEIRKGRDINIQGAHVKGDNMESIGICVCGHFEEDYPNKLQIKALRILIKKLFKEFGELQLLGHKDFSLADTLCPGQHLYELLPGIKKKLRIQK